MCENVLFSVLNIATTKMKPQHPRSWGAHCQSLVRGPVRQQQVRKGRRG